MELLRITRQIHCKTVEQRATLILRQYNRDWGTSYCRPPIDPYLTSPPCYKILAAPLQTTCMQTDRHVTRAPMGDFTFPLNMGVRTWGQMGSANPPGKIDEKLKSENMQQNKSSFLCLCYILRAIGAGRCRERRYADHIFIQIYFRMHHFVVRFSKFSSPQAAMGH